MNAREVLNEILERTTGDRLQTHSCREWLEEWVKGKQGATAAKTMLKYSQVARDFLKYLGRRAELPLTAISIQDFRSYRDKLAEGGRSPQTVNQLLHKTLTIPFNKARRFGLIPMNPLVAVESLTEDPGNGTYSRRSRLHLYWKLPGMTGGALSLLVFIRVCASST